MEVMTKRWVIYMLLYTCCCLSDHVLGNITYETIQGSTVKLHCDSDKPDTTVWWIVTNTTDNDASLVKETYDLVAIWSSYTGTISVHNGYSLDNTNGDIIIADVQTSAKYCCELIFQNDKKLFFHTTVKLEDVAATGAKNSATANVGIYVAVALTVAIAILTVIICSSGSKVKNIGKENESDESVPLQETGIAEKENESGACVRLQETDIDAEVENANNAILQNVLSAEGLPEEKKSEKSEKQKSSETRSSHNRKKGVNNILFHGTDWKRHLDMFEQIHLLDPSRNFVRPYCTNMMPHQNVLDDITSYKDAENVGVTLLGYSVDEYEDEDEQPQNNWLGKHAGTYYQSVRSHTYKTMVSNFPEVDVFSIVNFHKQLCPGAKLLILIDEGRQAQFEKEYGRIGDSYKQIINTSVSQNATTAVFESLNLTSRGIKVEFGLAKGSLPYDIHERISSVFRGLHQQAESLSDVQKSLLSYLGIGSGNKLTITDQDAWEVNVHCGTTTGLQSLMLNHKNICSLMEKFIQTEASDISEMKVSFAVLDKYQPT